MQESIRLVIVVATLALAAVRADQTRCNPNPQAAAVAARALCGDVSSSSDLFAENRLTCDHKGAALR
ncbi:MAG: hypothetical protein ACRYFU_20865 [Janthinobacterium lividum]